MPPHPIHLNPPAGTAALADASLVPALLPLLEHRDAAHLALVASTVRILEAFMDFRWVLVDSRGLIHVWIDSWVVIQSWVFIQSWAFRWLCVMSVLSEVAVRSAGVCCSAGGGRGRVRAAAWLTRLPALRPLPCAPSLPRSPSSSTLFRELGGLGTMVEVGGRG